LIAIALAADGLIAPADDGDDVEVEGDGEAEFSLEADGDGDAESSLEAEGDGEAESSLKAESSLDGDGVTTVPSGNISTTGGADGADGSSLPAAASAVPPRASAATAATAAIVRAEAVRSLIMRTSGVCCAEHHQVRVRRAMAALCDR
jgi:hypothetical protein